MATGFAGITRYDPNKLSIYHQLYDQLARFEIPLRQFIRAEAPDWSSRTTVTLGVHGSSDLVPDRLTATQLRDLIRIVRELGLHDEFGVGPLGTRRITSRHRDAPERSRLQFTWVPDRPTTTRNAERHNWQRSVTFFRRA